MRCPRRNEDARSDLMFPHEDGYRDDDTCSFCGSLNPDTFMTRLEAGELTLGTTDKNYKVYVTVASGPMLKQTYRDCPSDGPRCAGPNECTHWITRESNHGKFYFQHLSVEQRQRFVELYNDQRLVFEGGYSFYVLPFFFRIAPKP